MYLRHQKSDTHAGTYVIEGGRRGFGRQRPIEFGPFVHVARVGNVGGHLHIEWNLSHLPPR